jgi:hypothetical protein
MIRVVHPGSRIRMLTFYQSWIPDPGVKKAPDHGSGSATLFFCRRAFYWLYGYQGEAGGEGEEGAGGPDEGGGGAPAPREQQDPSPQPDQTEADHGHRGCCQVSTVQRVMVKSSVPDP